MLIKILRPLRRDYLVSGLEKIPTMQTASSLPQISASPDQYQQWRYRPIRYGPAQLTTQLGGKLGGKPPLP